MDGLWVIDDGGYGFPKCGAWERSDIVYARLFETGNKDCHSFCFQFVYLLS